MFPDHNEVKIDMNTRKINKMPKNQKIEKSTRHLNNTLIKGKLEIVQK